MPYVATRGGPSLAAPSDGSRTITLHDSQPHEEGGSNEQGDAVGTIQLAGGNRTRGEQRVVWSEDVVDNEGAGKKSSKSMFMYKLFQFVLKIPCQCI